MHDVEAHVAGPRDAAHGVQVGAVVVEESANLVEDLCDLFDVLVEEPERRGVREHEPGGPLVDHLPQVRDVDVAARVRLDLRELVPGHRDARGVRAVRGVGGDDGVALIGLAAVGEVRAHHHQARQLPLRARGRLQRARVQARHFDQDLLEPPHQLERALNRLLVLVGMQVPEAGKHREPLVDARVVLHRAGAERIEARVDAEVARRELREVPDDLGLGELGEPRRNLAAQLVRHLRRREVVAR